MTNKILNCVNDIVCSLVNIESYNKLTHYEKNAALRTIVGLNEQLISLDVSQLFIDREFNQ